MFKVTYKEQDKIRFQPNFKPWNLVIYQFIFIKRVMEQFSTLSFQPVWKHVKHIGLAKMFGFPVKCYEKTQTNILANPMIMFVWESDRFCVALKPNQTLLGWKSTWSPLDVCLCRLPGHNDMGRLSLP